MHKTKINDRLCPDLSSQCLYGKDNIQKNPHPVFTRNTNEKIYSTILDCIGNTPMIKLNKIPISLGVKCDVLVKCEYLNPGGSIKDRVSSAIVQEAENRGLINSGSTVIEMSSGNTGIALSMISAVKGFKSVIVVPAKSSIEKGNLSKALGGQIVRTERVPYNEPGGLYTTGAEIHKNTPNSYMTYQCSNPANPLIHYYTTALEMYEQCDEQIDMIAMATGSGGTMSGIGRKLKELMPKCVIVGVDPYGSSLAEPVLLHETDDPHFELEGVGFDPDPIFLDKKLVDYWVKVSDKDSMNMARRLHREEGILCGEVSGAALYGALKAAKSLETGQKCVVMITDGIGNYYSKFVSDYWMELRNFIPCKNSFNHWWWNCPVSLLKPTIELTISSTITCEKFLKIVKNSTYDILPVVDDKNNVKGIISGKIIMEAILNSTAKLTDCVKKVMSENFKTVTMNSTFGILSRILDNEKVAVVVENKKVPNQKDQKLIGILVPADLLQYIAKHNPYYE